jgi:hypothetical protein
MSCAYNCKDIQVLWTTPVVSHKLETRDVVSCKSMKHAKAKLKSPYHTEKYYGVLQSYDGSPA